MRTMDLLSTVLAGAIGAAVTALLAGASVVLAVPAAVGVGLVVLLAERTRPSR